MTELTFNENHIYQCLAKYIKGEIGRDNYKLIDGRRFVYVPVSLMKEMFDLSAYRQRNLLAKLEECNYLAVKLGQSRTRYMSLDEPNRAALIILRKQIKQAVDKCSDSDLLERIWTLVYRKC